MSFPKYDKNKDYCSFVPDKLFGVNFNYAGYIHDRQYRNEVLNRKTRLQADKEFRYIIHRTYSYSGLGWLGYVISRVYYIGVRLFGGFAWL